MTNTWLKIKVWSKIVIVAILVIYAILFLVFNMNQSVTVWIWGKYHINVLPLIFCTFLFGVVATILVRTSFRTLRQIQELRGRTQAQRLQRDIDEMKSKAGRLQTRDNETIAPQEKTSQE